MYCSRSFSSGILIHCYQNTRDGFLLFHSLSDYLVLFTNICVAAKAHGVRVVALCFMPEHLHSAVVASSREDLSSFVRDYTSSFAQDYKRTWKHHGPLFNTPFGSALKKGAKAARTNLIYIGNNPVERQLTAKAEDYRWNFLSYKDNPYPFSEPYIVRRSSSAMKKAVEEVRSLHSCGMPVRYSFLHRIFKTLDDKEKHQLSDFIISTYSIIDYDYAARFFDGWSDMISAMKFNTGSEYDINETFVGRSDAVYNVMSSYIIAKLHPKDIHDIFLLDEQAKVNLANELHLFCRVSPIQIAKYLHMKLTRQ